MTDLEIQQRIKRLAGQQKRIRAMFSVSSPSKPVKKEIDLVNKLLNDAVDGMKRIRDLRSLECNMANRGLN